MKVGDRVRLASPMVDDPDPVPMGTEGTVDYISDLLYKVDPLTGNRRWYRQVGVQWDNGRGLMCIVPPDRLESA